MKKIVNNWHYISVFLAGAVALAAILVPMAAVTKLLLAAIAVLFLHFFEEFGWPGGFPWMGMKVLMNSDEPDSSKWNVNNLSSMFGNWGFLLLVYILPLFLPNVRFLTLAAFMFLFAEVLMHCVLFPIRLRRLYNAGIITSLGAGIIACCYFFGGVFQSDMFVWYDWVIAVVWFAVVFVFCFRSKLYWGLGKKPGYPLTEQSAFGPFRKA